MTTNEEHRLVLLPFYRRLMPTMPPTAIRVERRTPPGFVLWTSALVLFTFVNYRLSNLDDAADCTCKSSDDYPL